ncbi:MAG: TldD/PmbA family protein [Promethearchaeati archaeon SRVP18_Atabeyarchaeia-1]
MDLPHTAERIVKMAQGEGAERVEVFLESRENLVMRISRVSGKENLTTRDQTLAGAGIRVIKGGSLGFAYLSNLEDESIKSSVRSALKVAEPQPGLESFPAKPSGYPRVSGIYDKHAAEMGPEEAMSQLVTLRKAAKEVDPQRITVYDSLFGRSRHGFAVVNTEGLMVDDYGSFVRMALGISAKYEDRESKIEVYNVERTVKGTDNVSNFASNYSGKILKYRGARTIEPKKMPVVLSPHAVAELFTYAFANAFLADNVRDKASPLEGKIGKQIGSDILTLVDDGTYEGGLASFKMDDEGMPSKRTVLVENGILKGYLHNSQSARIASVQSTGNCVRWEMPSVDYFYYRSFRRLPRIYPTNLVFKPGAMSLNSMISEVRDGIYIERSDPAFTARPDGSFSVTVLNGLRIENGELTTPASDVRIAGNIFDYAKKIDAIGDKPEKCTPMLYPSCVVSPPIRIQDVTIQT